MNYRQFSIARDGGEAKISCHEWRPAESSSVTFIAVHGLGDHDLALPYRRLAGALAGTGHRVISYDQREHGSAATDSPERARLPGLVEDLCTVARHARMESPVTPLIAVGLSMGTIVSLLACSNHAEIVDGVVAASAPTGPVSAGRLTVLTATVLGRLLPGLSLDADIDLSAATDNADDLAEYLSDPKFRTRVRLGLASDLLAATKELQALACKLPIPVLFLHGKLDRIAPWSDELPAKLQGGERVVRIFDHGHHNFLSTTRVLKSSTRSRRGPQEFAAELGWQRPAPCMSTDPRLYQCHPSRPWHD